MKTSDITQNQLNVASFILTVFYSPPFSQSKLSKVLFKQKNTECVRLAKEWNGTKKECVKAVLNRRGWRKKKNTANVNEYKRPRREIR